MEKGFLLLSLNANPAVRGSGVCMKHASKAVEPILKPGCIIVAGGRTSRLAVPCNVSGRGAPLINPSLFFLRGHGDVVVADSCNGLLLCRCRATGAPYRYVVCNPATEEWVALPVTSQGETVRNARLGFDPAVFPHFHVFEFLEMYPWEDGEISVPAMKIYSSKTRLWAQAESGWSNYARLCDDMSTVFLNGFLHVLASLHQYVLVVDTEGKVQRTIPVPHGNDDGFTGHSQGRLYYLNTIKDRDPKVKVHVLEDYSGDDWVLKHSVSASNLLGRKTFGLVQYHHLIAIHPHCNLVFFASDVNDNIRCYDMDRRKVRVIRNLGSERSCGIYRCLPYVPLFLESLAGLN